VLLRSCRDCMQARLHAFKQVNGCGGHPLLID
jgi:hypothetical protein